MTRIGENAGKARINEMTGRERWLKSFHFEPVDRPVNIEFGYWEETLPIWQKSGLPEEVDTHEKGHRYFGLDFHAGAPTPNGLIPHFEHKVIAEGDGYRDVQQGDGSVIREHAGITTSTIPEHLSYPVSDRDSWNEFKKRLDPDDPARFPDAEKLKERFAERDYPLGVGAGSLFGWVRDWMGFENACMVPHLDPVLFEEMMERICDVICAVLERMLPVLQFDYAAMWEDMCFNAGPMMNPEHFDRFCVPRYRRISELCHKHGVDIIYTDCDGNIDALVPYWLKAGINGMFPLEMAGGSDPVKYRKEYGHDVLLFGGVNKRELAKGREAIDAELERLRPVVEDGGFAPHCDHRCPPDVSLENYIYYMERKVEVFGMA